MSGHQSSGHPRVGPAWGRSRAVRWIIALALVFTGCGIKASPRPPDLPVAEPAETVAPLDAEPALDPTQTLPPGFEDETEPFEEESIF